MEGSAITTEEKDEYGNEVGVAARRVPVAYLLVDVPVGVARDGPPTLNARAAFPPANRPLHDQLQTLRALHHHIHQYTSFLDAMSDLHVLLYLATNEALPLSEEALAPLLEAVRARDAAAADAWRQTPHAATLHHLMQASADQEEMGMGADGGMEGVSGGAAGGGGVWTCAICTFHNAGHRDTCEMCAMPRNGM
ncbi:hypothetical protein O0L34_g18040 [Tuta absoluta]|nr:hypothetical protein O0L34_g18040 [Tuta absoluta]